MFVFSVLFATNQSLAANYGRLCASIKPDQWSVDPDACISPYERYRVGLASVAIGSRDKIVRVFSWLGFPTMINEVIEPVNDILFDACDNPVHGEDC